MSSVRPSRVVGCLLDVSMLPELRSPIPDETHPSDHLPIKATLRMRGAMERMEAAARAWTIAVLEGTVDGVPLTRDQLRLGFTQGGPAREQRCEAPVVPTLPERGGGVPSKEGIPTPPSVRDAIKGEKTT